ncbi:MAG: putative 2OG-Fe(II) oxygenase [Pseudomonadota bacterium]
MSASSPQKNPHLKQLWPVTILSRRFGKFQKINPELIQLFRQYQADNPRGSGSVYSSPDNFAETVDSPALKDLEKFILDNIFAVAAELNGSYWPQGLSLDVRMTGLWFQISNGYGFHETHVHGNCSWSGVYYVQSGSASKRPGDVGDNGMPNGITRFYGPHMEYQAAGHGDYGNYYLQDHVYDSFPEDGKLVIFPSYLKHMVFPYNGDEDRIIVSFHAIVDGDKELRYGYSFS